MMPALTPAHTPVYTTTVQRTLDGALDKILQLERERDNALDSIGAFLKTHPEFEDDHDLSLARLALL